MIYNSKSFYILKINFINYIYLLHINFANLLLYKIKNFFFYNFLNNELGIWLKKR